MKAVVSNRTFSQLMTELNVRYPTKIGGAVLKRRCIEQVLCRYWGCKCCCILDNFYTQITLLIQSGGVILNIFGDLT
jgi:hypothetical protein